MIPISITGQIGIARFAGDIKSSQLFMEETESRQHSKQSTYRRPAMVNQANGNNK